jgi:hypothetical protein
MSDRGRQGWDDFWKGKAELDAILEDTNTPIEETTDDAGTEFRQDDEGRAEGSPDGEGAD